MHTDHPEPHDLTALAYDMIEGPQRIELLEHLAVCDACRATYDSYRTEQTIVRDAIVRDARSGASEAAALERTLTAIAAGGEAKPRGRTIRLAWWLVAAEVAAVAVIALGLFVFMNPGSDTQDPTVVPIADSRRAPAKVSEGDFLVSQEGGWKPASALPMDTWVMAGPQALSFELPDGSVAELDRESVFRLAKDDSGGELVLFMLVGEGRLNAGRSVPSTRLRAGDAGFQAMPGASVQVSCEADGLDWRGSPDTLLSWSRPSRVKGTVMDGDVVMIPMTRGMKSVPMQGGEVVRWTPAGFEGSGNEMMRFAYAGHTGGTDGGPNAEAIVMIRQRLDGMRSRLDDKQMQLFLKGIEGEWSGAWHEAGKAQSVEVRIVQARPGTTTTREVDGLRVERTSSEHQHWARVTQDGKTREYTAYTLEDLLKQLPEAARELAK